MESLHSKRLDAIHRFLVTRTELTASHGRRAAKELLDELMSVETEYYLKRQECDKEN